MITKRSIRVQIEHKRHHNSPVESMDKTGLALVATNSGQEVSAGNITAVAIAETLLKLLKEEGLGDQIILSMTIHLSPAEPMASPTA